MCREWSGSVGCGADGDAGVVVDGDDVVAFGDCVYIRLSKKKTAKGLKRLAIAATAKSPWASSRSSQKLNDGKCKWLLLLLCLKKQDR